MNKVLGIGLIGLGAYVDNPVILTTLFRCKLTTLS